MWGGSPPPPACSSDESGFTSFTNAHMQLLHKKEFQLDAYRLPGWVISQVGGYVRGGGMSREGLGISRYGYVGGCLYVNSYS